MYTRNFFDVPIVFCFLLTLLIFMLTYLGANGFSIKLIPRYSIDSMLFPKNLSLLEKHFRIAKLSKARALHFESMGFVDAINSTKQGIEALQPKIEYSLENFYIAQMNIGTPPYSALLLLDTGTDNTWVQAAKCAICFPLKYEGFDYRKFETYYAYFKSTSFLEAQVGNNPSYTWRSLMEAKSVVERGMRWSIGNGRSVDIWRDRWLPTPNSFKVISPRSQESSVEKVEHLLDSDRRAWDINKVRSIFLPFEAETVLGIPISPSLPNDSRIWAWTSNGIFTVRSAYGVALKMLKDNKEKEDKGECSDPSKMDEVWKSIWRLECPGKIKHFLWRACKNILPTNFCLARRKVSKWDGCAWCGETESSSHVLWDCKAAAEVWKESGLNLPRWKNDHRDFIEVFWKLKEEAKDIDWVVFATTAWSIWSNRNRCKHEGKFKPGKIVVKEVTRYVEEFRQGFTSNSTTPKQPPRLGSQWRPPDAGWYKVNVDAAVFKEAGSCGVGVVVRNEEGCLMGAMSKKLPFPLGPLEAEARAAEEGIALARDLGLNEVVIEGDAKTVMTALANSDSLHTPSSIQKVMEGAKFRLQAFKSWQSRHVHRNCNVAAHMLAKHACNVLDSLIWVEDTPPMISAQMSMDVANLGLSLN